MEVQLQPLSQGAQPFRCLICSMQIESSTSRRKLGSRATKHIIPIVQGLAARKCHGSEILLDDASYLCQPCFRRLETVSKLRQKLKENEIRIMDDIQRCVTSGLISLVSTSLDICSSPLTATPTRPRVRTSPSVHASPHTRVTAQVPAGSASSVHGSPSTPRRRRVLAGQSPQRRVGY